VQSSGTRPSRIQYFNYFYVYKDLWNIYHLLEPRNYFYGAAHREYTWEKKLTVCGLELGT
jgi:hypothetical protein